MSLACKTITTASGCLVTAAGVASTITIHYEYRDNAAGNTVLHATRYTDASGSPIALALGETVSVGTATDKYAGYAAHQIDEATVGTTYIRKSGANTTGSWIIQRIVESGTDTTISYAGVRNNAAITTAPAAWAGRASLTYGEIRAA